MPILISCPTCQDPESKIPVRVQNQGRARASCAKGHTIAIVLCHPQFDLLAQIAAEAIVDGYYRDAVSSFAASLERFYEFYFRVISKKNGILEDQVEQAWKRVARQSERQLGLFIGAYLSETGVAPPLLSEKSCAFRNSVIHQGSIPTEAEAIEFGQQVIDVSYPIARDIYSRFPEEVRAVQKSMGDWNWDFAQPGDVNMSAAGGMIFNLSMSAPPTFNLAENLAFRRSQRSRQAS
ncbi:MAG TPA: hypothetical protein VEX35_03625 [Allosphingosinicella sp.]|nr:hypothetical protein [Allosphingosinicella sp.]